MPLSKCYYTARNINHEEYWEFAAGYITVWVILTVVSTLILRASGSIKPSRLHTWLATWDCFKGCFPTPLMEILSWIIFIITCSPGAVLIVWLIATFSWDTTYDGVTPHAYGGFTSYYTYGQDFVNVWEGCKTLTATIFVCTFSFDLMRLGMFTWYFREWVIDANTKLLLGTGGFLMLCFTFMLANTVENYDDVVTATFFLTVSSLFVVPVIYNYLDDLSIDLSSYLHSSTEEVHSKGTADGTKEKWSFTKYALFVFGNIFTLLFYAFSGIWITSRTTSPMYVYPWVQLVDIAVAFSLHKATARDINEVLSAIFIVIGFRVIVLFLGMQDRDCPNMDMIESAPTELLWTAAKAASSDCKQGAWEFVQPVFYLVCMIGGAKGTATGFWKIMKNDNLEIVQDDRYSQWLIHQRRAVVAHRNEDSSGTNFANRMRACLFMVGRVFGFSSDISRRTTMELAEQEIQDIKEKMLDRKAIEIDYEKEKDFKKFLVNLDDFKVTDQCGVKRPGFKVGADMDEAAVEETKKRLSAHKMERSKMEKRIRGKRLLEFFATYRYLFFFTIIHICYSIVCWYKRAPIDRSIWPFGYNNTIRASNFAWLVLMYGFAAFIWTFVYCALTCYALTYEDIDEERETVRQLLASHSSSDCKISSNGRASTRMHPRPLSYQHQQARDRYDEVIFSTYVVSKGTEAEDLEKTIKTALDEGDIDQNRKMLKTERPKIIAEAVTFFMLSKWVVFFKEVNNKKEPLTDVSDLKNFCKTSGGFNDLALPTDEDIEKKYNDVFQNYKHSEQDADNTDQSKAKAFRETLSALVLKAITSIAYTARQHAGENGADRKQQIGAAILSATFSHSYFMSSGFGYNIKTPLKDLCTSIAAQAAHAVDKDQPLTSQEKINAHTEHTFMGLDRQREVLKIAESETRWPRVGGLDRSKVREVFKFKEVITQSGFGSIVGMFFGVMLTVFLAVVLNKDSGDNTEWLGADKTGNQRHLLISIFVPLMVISLFIVTRSWIRNKFYFWCNNTDMSLAQRFAVHRAGLMRSRDRINFRFVVLGVVMFIGWFVSTVVVIGPDEGFTCGAAVIMLVTTIIPIMRAQQHKLASSFLEHMFMYGFVAVLILLIVYWLIQDSWVLPAFACAYYSLVALYLTTARSSMHGWEDHSLLASIDKNTIFPVGAFMACIYQWFKDNHEGDSDARRMFILGMGAVLIAIILLLTFFWLAHTITIKFQGRYTSKKRQHRHKLRMDYLELGDVVPMGSGTVKQANDSVGEKDSLTSLGDDEDDHQDESHENLGCCESTGEWIDSHQEELGMGAIWFVLMAGGVIAIALYAKDQDTSYSQEQRFLMFGTVIFGLQAIMNFGLYLVLDRFSEGWSYSASTTVLPVIVPQRGTNNHGFEFKKGVVPSNVPTGCGYGGFACILWWGILACLMPDIDFMFGDSQMVVGVMAISGVLMVVFMMPFIKTLQLSFIIAKNYHQIVTQPHCMTPVIDIDRSVSDAARKLLIKRLPKQEIDFEDDECQLDQEEMMTISKESFSDCFKVVGGVNQRSAYAAVKEFYNEQNPNNKKNDNNLMWQPDTFKKELYKLFYPDEITLTKDEITLTEVVKYHPPTEPDKDEPEEKKKYTVNQLLLFFRFHCLQYGSLKWNTDFLKEKREDATKELHTCRALYTMEADSKSKETHKKLFTPRQLAKDLEVRKFPAAMATTLCGSCTSYKGEVAAAGDRRGLFSNIFKKSQYSINLSLEEISFEGHFALSVAHSAEQMTVIDSMANFALHGNVPAVVTNDEDGADAEDAEDADDAGTVSVEWPIPVKKFNTAIAETVDDTRNPPGTSDQDREMRGVDKASLGDQRDWTPGYAHKGLKDTNAERDEYNKAIKNIKEQVMCGGVANGLNGYFQALRLIFEFYGKGSAPPERKIKFEGSEAGRLGELKILDKSDWDDIFGNLTPGTTLYDMFLKTKMLREKWSMFCDPVSLRDDPEQTQEPAGCYDRLQSPVVYGASLFLEFYDVPLFVSMYGSGSKRYRKLKQTINNVNSFRMFIEMCDKQTQDYPALASLGQQKAFTQLIQDSQTVMEALESGCELIFGNEIKRKYRVHKDENGKRVPSDKIDQPNNHRVVFSPSCKKCEPHLGPSVLREATMRLKAQAVYEVVFKTLVKGKAHNKLSIDDLEEWGEKLKERHNDRCARNVVTKDEEIKLWETKFSFLSTKKFMKDHKDGIDMETFRNLHPTVTGNKAIGNLTGLVGAPGWKDFNRLLDDVSELWIADSMKDEKMDQATATKKFSKMYDKTENFEVLKWFEQSTSSVDDMFENCFYFKNTSYLHHFSQTKNAVKEKAADMTFETYFHDFTKNILSCEYTAEGEWKKTWKLPTNLEEVIELKPFMEQAMHPMEIADKLKVLHPDAHKNLSSLCMLFMAPREVRRDWAAMYRVWRIVHMSRQDGDSGSKDAQDMMDQTQFIERHLSNALGNHDREEELIQGASSRIYCNIDAAGARQVSTDKTAKCILLTDNKANEIDQEGEGACKPEKRCPDCKEHMKTRTRGFMLLPGTSEFVTSEFKEQHPQKFDTKVDFWLLDKVLVVNSKEKVNLTTEDNLRDVTNPTTPRTTRNESEDVSLEVAESEESSHDAALDDAKLVQLNVIRASLLLPLTHVEEIPVPKEADDQDALRVLKVEGKRRVGKAALERVYYFASYDKDDHYDLLKILKLQSSQIDLEPRKPKAEPAAVVPPEPAPAEDITTVVGMGVSPEPTSRNAQL